LSIREDIITLAQSLGFIDIGFANGRKLSSETERYKNWIRSGYHADMYYLDKNFDKKEDISLIFESAKSVIALAYPYKTSFEHSSGDAKISKYAWGSDYHDIVKKKLKQIALYLKTTCPDSENRVYVDTGPTLDRQWAIEAGLGWQGKNGNIINPKYGSMFFIGLIITSISFTSNETIKNMCGKCTACIESCPTNAIVAPKVVDSNKCIAYWTIEAKPDIPIPDDIANSLNGWAYGCDICQDVCPWNKRLTFNTEDELLKPRFGETNFDIETIYSMTDEDFRNRYSKSPIKRTKLEGIKRNIAALNRVGGA
jgi:epoxyqueuosine reductase